MAMISPICLEHLVEIGKWMGLAGDKMEKALAEEQVIIQGEDLGEGRKFRVLAGYYLGEVEQASLHIMKDCPQRGGDDGSQWIEDDPRNRFASGLNTIQKDWEADQKIASIMKMKLLEEALMEWVNDIAFAGPSRVAVRK
jgi:hypothetical protein